MAKTGPKLYWIFSAKYPREIYKSEKSAADKTIEHIAGWPIFETEDDPKYRFIVFRFKSKDKALKARDSLKSARLTYVKISPIVAYPF